MNHHDATSLLASAIPAVPGTWADLGAGEGTFTLALATVLGPGSRIYAVDRDARALARIRTVALPGEATIIAVVADFTRDVALPLLGGTMLSGIILANALHFVRDADAVLARLVARLAPGASAVFIEYDNRPASRWVPYPIPHTRLPVLTRSAGLSAPEVTATYPSAFGGSMYVARATRLAT